MDAGYYGDYSCYSCIWNEILCGDVPDITSFRERLNGNLLFRDVYDCMQLIDARKRALAAGADLERGGPDMIPISIFARSTALT
jgi:hypothetical protein